MNPVKIFVHGVPDSPRVWTPLLNELSLDASEVHVPALPGIGEPAPRAIDATKDGYAQWLIREVEDAYQKSGPVDIFGHDWGAILTLRVASLRPELFHTWTISNAIIEPGYRGHIVARCWNTPLVGELMMKLTSTAALERGLKSGGLPAELAADDARRWRAGFAKRNILALYRSANGLRFRGAWMEGLAALPPRGMVVWGENDPYVGIEVARRFCAARNVPLAVIRDAGHWAICQRPAEVASLLTNHWSAS